MEWRSVVGYEGYYEVSDEGWVRSLPKQNRKHMKVLLPVPQKHGHLMVHLSINGRSRKEYVHRLVAIAFLGKPQSENMEVCHNDGKPANNTLGNLRWGTASENQADRRLHGTASFGSRHGRALLSEAQVVAIRQRLSAGETKASLAREFGVSESTIRSANSGVNWRHLK